MWRRWQWNRQQKWERLEDACHERTELFAARSREKQGRWFAPVDRIFRSVRGIYSMSSPEGREMNELEYRSKDRKAVGVPIAAWVCLGAPLVEIPLFFLYGVVTNREWRNIFDALSL